MDKIEIIFKSLNILNQDTEYISSGKSVTTTYDLNSVKTLNVWLSRNDIKKHKKYKSWVYIISPLLSALCSLPPFIIILAVISLVTPYNFPDSIIESITFFLLLILIFHFLLFKRYGTSEVFNWEMKRVAKENNHDGCRSECFQLEDWGSFLRQLLHKNSCDRTLVGYYRILNEHSQDIGKLKKDIYKKLLGKRHFIDQALIDNLSDALTVWDIYEQKIIKYR